MLTPQPMRKVLGWEVITLVTLSTLAWLLSFHVVGNCLVNISLAENLPRCFPAKLAKSLETLDTLQHLLNLFYIDWCTKSLWGQPTTQWSAPFKDCAQWAKAPGKKGHFSWKVFPIITIFGVLCHHFGTILLAMSVLCISISVLSIPISVLSISISVFSITISILSIYISVLSFLPYV